MTEFSPFLPSSFVALALIAAFDGVVHSAAVSMTFTEGDGVAGPGFVIGPVAGGNNQIDTGATVFTQDGLRISTFGGSVTTPAQFSYAQQNNSLIALDGVGIPQPSDSTALATAPTTGTDFVFYEITIANPASIGSFTLESFSIAGFESDTAAAGDIDTSRVSFEAFANNTSVGTFTLDDFGIADFSSLDRVKQTVSFGTSFQDVTRIQFNQLGQFNQYQIDDLSFVTAIPEPAGVLPLGLAMLCSMSRRRSHAR